jgi:hypothetical protein
MSDAATPKMTLDAFNAAVVSHGKHPDPVHTFRIGDIPLHNLLALISKGLTHMLGNEASAKVSGARNKLIKEYVDKFPEAERAAAAAYAKANPAEIMSESAENTVYQEARAYAANVILTGTVGRSESSGERVSPLAAKMRAIAKEELAAMGVVFGKKLADAVKNEFRDDDGNVMTVTGEDLIDSHVAANHDEILKTIEKRAKEAEKAAARALAKGGLTLAGLGLVKSSS